MSVALEAAGQLGPGVRVVSVPSFRRFDLQPQSYGEAPPRASGPEDAIRVCWEGEGGIRGMGTSWPHPPITILYINFFSVPSLLLLFFFRSNLDSVRLHSNPILHFPFHFRCWGVSDISITARAQRLNFDANSCPTPPFRYYPA